MWGGGGRGRERNIIWLNATSLAAALPRPCCLKLHGAYTPNSLMIAGRGLEAAQGSSSRGGESPLEIKEVFEDRWQRHAQ